MRNHILVSVFHHDAKAGEFEIDILTETYGTSFANQNNYMPYNQLIMRL